MNLDALKTLAAVIELESFSRAGRSLGYTQSAVSQQMAVLERQLGLLLFERRARSIQPTEAARFLYERTGQLVSLVERVETDAARLSAGQSGRIRLGLFSSAGADLFPRAVARFLIRRREVQVTLHEGEPDDLLPQVVQGELDVALVFRYDGIPVRWPSDIEVTALMTDPLQVIAPKAHRLAKQRDVHLIDLVDDSWISTGVETYGNECLLRTTALAGFQPNFLFNTNNFGSIQGLVRSSLGVAMIPSLACAADPDLIRLPFEKLPQRHIAVVTRSVEHSPLVDSFITAVREVAVDIEATGNRRWR